MTGLVLLLGLDLLVGCNHLYYYPDHATRLTPDKVDLNYSEHTLVEPDGTRLRLWHMPPVGRNRKTVIVQFHGNAENMSTHFLFVAWLAAAGYDVVTFDYRGYGKSGGAPDRKGLLSDGATVLDWVAHAPSLRGKSVVVYAQSLGVAVAIPVIASARPSAQAVQVLVAESGFDSYRLLARTKLASFWFTWPLQYPLSFLISDEDSPADHLGQLKIPFLAIHGTNDEVVPIEHGRALYAASISKDKQFWEVPKGGHTPAFTDEGSPWRERFLTYLCQHTGHCGKDGG